MTGKNRFMAGMTMMLLAMSLPALAAPSPVSVRILNHHNNDRIGGRTLHLALAVSPAPTSAAPVHLHVYVNGKMSTMVSILKSPQTVTLHHLSRGKDVITFVLANPMTHQEMGGKESMGKMDDMGGMGGMDMGNDDSHQMDHGSMGQGEKVSPLATLTIEVR